MDFILWRHAQAEDGEPNASRVLTMQGRKQAVRMGTWLDLMLPETCRVLTSPALRCSQTAEALGRKLKVVPEIGIMASPGLVLQIVGCPDSRIPVLVVGHQPWLGQLAALLLGGELQEWTIKKANAWWFSGRHSDDDSDVYLCAVMAPEFFVD